MFTGPESMAEQLIENGADVNVIDDNDNSPLIVAIYKGIERI